jgi:hypothetical protein
MLHKVQAVRLERVLHTHTQEPRRRHDQAARVASAAGEQRRTSGWRARLRQSVARGRAHAAASKRAATYSRRTLTRM